MQLFNKWLEFKYRRITIDDLHNSILTTYYHKKGYSPAYMMVEDGEEPTESDDDGKFTV